MVIDHCEIEALKSDARPTNDAAQSESRSPDLAAPAAAPVSPALARIRTLRVPLIAQLASRKLPLARIRRLSIGTILEFERNVEEPLELLANNRPIGRGIAVKIGENFGLRITAIRDAATRVRSLGGGASSDT